MPSRTDGDFRTEAGRVPGWMQQALHDLCQPLTALEGRLYLSTMELPKLFSSEEVSTEDLRVATSLEIALGECERMRAMVRLMQERMALQEHGANWNERGAGDERFTELSSERVADSSAIGGSGERRRRSKGPVEKRSVGLALDRK